MSCKTRPLKSAAVDKLSLPVVDLPYWSARRQVCQPLDCSDGDTCIPTEEKHPGKSSIESGTMRKDLACPLGHWKAIPEACPLCSRKYQITAAGICVWCENAQKVARRNADNRKRKRRKISPTPRLTRVPTETVVVQPRTNATWAVAVTTAPRKGCTLTKCLDSIRDAGWGRGEVTVFAEPGSTAAPGVTRVDNPAKLGVWHNWLASCQASLAKSPDFVLTSQDDSLYHYDSRELIESINWPANAAFVSLYTPSHYSFDGSRKRWRPIGIKPIYTRSLWGACALVWRPDALTKVIDHPIAKSWLGASHRTLATKRKHPEQIANSDTAIGRICNAMGLAMYFVDPSPVQHIAKHSTIKNHGGNTGNRNTIRPADRLLSLIPQVFPQ